MKHYKYIPAGLILLLITAFTLHTEKVDFTRTLKDKLAVFLMKYQEENIYIQTDKSFYKQGESVWFNTFLLNSTTHLPSEISDVIYVELRDPKGNVSQKRELLAMNGTAKGDFNIGEKAPGGIYTLVAYTQWMKNFGEENYFRKELTVQQVITPRLLLKIDFEKKAYGRGDEVTALLNVTDLQNQKVKNGMVKTSVKINGELFTDFTVYTNEDGNAELTFKLPETLNTPDVLLQAVISDRGLEESISRSTPVVLDNIKITFYPEGGDMAENVATRVAFEALNEFGKGADVSGEIIDQNNTVITRFESFHQGMGSFELTPLKGKTYSARIIRPIGNNDPTPLPQALESGYVMNIQKQEKNKITWMIHSPVSADATFAARVHGKLVYSQSLSLRKGINNIETFLDEFPAGIAVFTLFDEKNNETCERLAFVNKEKILNIKLSPNKENYTPGEKVKLDIFTSDNTGKPVSADISLSVVDKQLISFADDKQDNMLTYLLLSSELKGKIHEPSFYFDDKEKNAPAAIDYLMLTHGWRRFTWKDVFKPTQKLTEGAEKINDIFGYVLDKDGKPKQADVYLIEYGSQKRLVKLRTTFDGQFVFHNVDVSANVMIATKLPDQIYIFKKRPVIQGNRISSSSDLDPNEAVTGIVEEQDYSTEKEESYADIRSQNIRLSENASQLDEVVTIGYGVARKSASMGYSYTVEHRREELLNPSLDVVLAGNIAGVVISQKQNIDPGKNTSNSLVLKGTTASSTGNTYPLLIFDNVLLNEAVNSNFSNWELINTVNIEYVNIHKNPSTPVLYGSKVSDNGVIEVKSKSARFGTKQTKPKYGGRYIEKRQFYIPNEFKSHQYNSEIRSNFNTTVYWNASVKTDNNGKATLNFSCNDATSVFSITAEGITSTGLIGRQEKDYSTLLPISADIKIPTFIGVSDSVYIPVLLKNTTEEDRETTLSLTVLDLYRKMPLPSYTESKKTDLSSYTESITVPKGETRTVYIPFTSNGRIGKIPVSVAVKSGDYSDLINQTITVNAIGFPKEVCISGSDTENTQTFVIDDIENNSFTVEAACYSNLLNDLKGGAESIFRKPYGCFEQVSSSTFPNIFALQYLQASKKGTPESEKIAMEYIEDGYKKLAGYESKGGGFEWFGGSPGHEVLTAYGLIEFFEMKKVFSGVDEEMMQRALEFLLGRRNGKGGFLQNRGKYGFSAAPEKINNAYIVYALGEIGHTNDLSSEYDHCMKEALASEDLYRMALMANAAYSFDKQDDYLKLTERFVELVETDKLRVQKIEGSIVSSYQGALFNETIALWCIALLKNTKNPNIVVLNKCIQILTNNRSFGGFGGTQATSLCLQALTKYAQYGASSNAERKFEVLLNNKLIINETFSPDKAYNGKLTDLKDYLIGKNTLTAKINEKTTYSLLIKWFSLTPESSELCPLRLSTTLKEKSVKVNETVRLATTLTNTQNTGQPMSIAVIGIPGGLSLQPWQLKEMQEKQVFDFYEITDNNLVIYYRELGPKEVKQINVDLKADIPGKYTGAASSAYLYYSDLYRHWVKGCEIEIKR